MARPLSGSKKCRLAVSTLSSIGLPAVILLRALARAVHNGCQGSHRGGLCGTDLHILEGEFAPSLPVVPGHEFAGVVVAVGSAVGELAVGTRVAVDPSLYCNECHYCRIGRNNLCERWAAIGVTTAGGAAEYAVAPVANCVPLPEHVRLEDAALVEPLACAVRGYDVLTSQLGSHVLIYGSGTMGLMMLQLAKRTGAASVDVVDLNPERRP